MASRSLVSILLVACAAAALTALAVTGRLVPGEASLARSAQDAPLGGAAEELADGLASPFVEFTLVGVMAAAALCRRQYALAATALLVFAGMALNPAFKELVRRDRPTAAEVTIREHAGGFGFPSGHAQSATLVYVYAMVCAWRLLPRPAAAVETAAALVAIAAIAFDRVYNGAHRPSDVAGGVLIGLLLAVAAFQLPELLRRWSAARAARGTATDPDLG